MCLIKKLVPPCQPVRFKTKTKGTLHTHADQSSFKHWAGVLSTVHECMLKSHQLSAILDSSAWVLKHETQANKFNSQAKAINSCPFKVCDLKLLILRSPTAALLKYQKCKLPF